MIKPLIAGIILMASLTSAYKAEEFFGTSESKPYLQFVKEIEARNFSAATELESQEKLDLNHPVSLPDGFDYHRLDGLSAAEIKLGDALAPGSRNPKETSTILNYFIANRDIKSMKEILKMGADPAARSSWYLNSYIFACEYNRANELDLLLTAKPFSSLSNSDQKALLVRLPKIETVTHWFSDPDYVLDPSLLKVALKNHVNFDLPTDFGTLLTDSMNLNGYDVVIWLLENNAARADQPDKSGKTVASIAADWLKNPSKLEKKRRKKLEIIKDILHKKGFELPSN
jgi:hypothetical protein